MSVLFVQLSRDREGREWGVAEGREGGREGKSDVRGKMWRFRGKRDGVIED